MRRMPLRRLLRYLDLGAEIVAGERLTESAFASWPYLDADTRQALTEGWRETAGLEGLEGREVSPAVQQAMQARWDAAWARGRALMPAPGG